MNSPTDETAPEPDFYDGDESLPFGSAQVAFEASGVKIQVTAFTGETAAQDVQLLLDKVLETILRLDNRMQ